MLPIFCLSTVWVKPRIAEFHVYWNDPDILTPPLIHYDESCIFQFLPYFGVFWCVWLFWCILMCLIILVCILFTSMTGISGLIQGQKFVRRPLVIATRIEVISEKFLQYGNKILFPVIFLKFLRTKYIICFILFCVDWPENTNYSK